MASNHYQFYADLRKTIILRKRNQFRLFLTPIFEIWKFESQSSTGGLQSDILGLQEVPKSLHRQQMINRIKRLEESVFNDIFDAYYQKTISIIRKEGGILQDAEDAFQEALIDLIDFIHRGKLDPKPGKKYPKTLENYIIKSVKNRWMKRFRDKNNTEVSSFEDISGLDNPKYLWEDSPERSDEYKLLHRAFARLSAACQRLLEEFYYKNQDYDTIVKNLGYANMKSAKSQKFKCMEKLRIQKDLIKFNS
jgi:RNA polymerase sigma factor (sigma-70 family)